MHTMSRSRINCSFLFSLSLSLFSLSRFPLSLAFLSLFLISSQIDTLMVDDSKPSTLIHFPIPNGSNHQFFLITHFFPVSTPHHSLLSFSRDIVSISTCSNLEECWSMIPLLGILDQHKTSTSLLLNCFSPSSHLFLFLAS